MLTNEQRAHDLALIAAQYVASPEYIAERSQNPEFTSDDYAEVYISEFRRLLPILDSAFPQEN